MKIGTRSLLYGVHQFALHPLLVAVAFGKLYPHYRSLMKCWGFWVAVVVHDWGYWGCPNMDGREGKQHPIAGAGLTQKLTGSLLWSQFAYRHSKSACAVSGEPVSELYHADKYAICLYPQWLYLLLGRASGEMREYMSRQGYAEGEDLLWLSDVQTSYRARYEVSGWEEAYLRV